MEINISYFTIGEISKITNVSPRMLRHFDKIGLVTPAYIDPENQYRYYSEEQIMIISFVRELRSQEFSLHDIKEILDKNEKETVINVFNRKIKEIDAMQNKLSKAKKRLLDFLDNYSIAFDFEFSGEVGKIVKLEVENLEKRLVVFVRRKIELAIKPMVVLFSELQNIIVKNELLLKGPYMAVFHDEKAILNDHVNACDVEVAVEIDESNSYSSSKFIRELPEETVISALYDDQNTHDATALVYNKLKEITKDKGYETQHPVYKLYFYRFQEKGEVKKAMSKLSIPISKIS
jgi:DNA-binding transcriptional MerR regulator